MTTPRIEAACDDGISTLVVTMADEAERLAEHDGAWK
jgi:hypothetical protein